MLLPTLLLLCALSSQMVYSHTPAGLRALANLHTQRSRAIANALNLRARTQYNTAIARARASNLGLYDHRFIRDSGKLLGDRINTDFGSDEQFPFHDINDAGDDLEDFLMRHNFENGIGDGAEDFTLQQRGAPQVISEDFVAEPQSEFNLNEGQPWKQQLEERENQDDILQIPLNFDNPSDSHESSTNPIYGDGAATSLSDNVEDIVHSETGVAILRPPQEVDYVADNSRIYSNPEEDSQFDSTHTCSVEHIGTPDMETVPPGAEYQNSNSAEQIPTTQPLFITYPATLDQQEYLENSGKEPVLEPHIRPQPNVAEEDLEGYDGRKSAVPTLHRHLRPHGHVFTHTHSYFHGTQPLQPNVQVPTAPVATPGINLNVIQNQNAAVNSQFATTAIQPGFNTANVNPPPVLHGNTGYATGYIGPSQSHGTSISQGQNIQTHSIPVMPNTQQFVHDFGGNAGHSSGVSQSQNIQSHSSQIMPNTQQYVHDLGGNAGHSSGISQSQNIQSHSSSVMPNTQQFVQDLRGNAGHSSSISQSQNIQSHSSPMMPNTQQFVHDLGGNAGHSSSVSQSQNIQSHSSSMMPNLGGNSGHGSGISQSQSIQTNSVPVQPNTGGNTISQTQSIHQGARAREPVDETNVADGPTVSAPIMQMGEARGQISHADEQVGTFLANAPMYVPEYHSDPTQPQNYQDVVRYIEREQESIRQLLHTVENDQYNREHQFSNNEPVYLHNSNEYEQPFYNNRPHTEYENMYGINRNARERLNKIHHMKGFPGSRLDGTHSQNEKVGTINMDHIELDPIPRNLQELEFNLRRHLEMEEQTVQDVLDQIDQNYRTNMHTISSLINPGHDNLHDPTHFQNYHEADPKQNIHIQEVDIPDDKSEKPESPPQLDEEVNYSQEEARSSKMLRKALGHDPDLQKTEEMNSEQDRLGYIIQIPERRYSDDYQRQARSTNQTAVKLDELLLKEKKVFNDLKKDAEHDEDLLMIGYIGDSLIEDMQNRVKKSRREKRQTGRIRDLPLHRLVTDPKAKFDMSKTLGNLGAVTRNVFEHEKAPLYHVRNMVGAAQDAVLATMKIPTKNFLIPSAYDIVNTQGDNDKVGAINPTSIFSRNGGENLRENGPIDGIMNTFQRVGSAIRGSVMSGQEVLTHVGDVANHAKNAIHSTKHTAPRVVWKKIPAITKEPKKIMLITPRIFDISGEDNQVGTTLGKTQPDFVKVGHILDAVGVSNPNHNDVEFEKIVIEPRNSFSDSSEKPIIRRPNSFKNLLESIRIIKMKNADDEDFVGNTLNSLNEARTTVGANSLKDFIVKMRREFRDVLRNGSSGKNIYRKAKARKIYKKLKKLDQNRTFPNISMENRFGKTEDIGTQGENNHQNFDKNPGKQENQINNNMADSDQETVGASFLPEETRHPFLDQATTTQRRQFMRENNYDDVDTSLHKNHRDKDRDLGQILGAINPMMFERIFNETLKVKHANATPHSVFHHHHSGHSHGHHHTGDMNGEDTVGTSMAVKGQITKPFMGHASNKRKQDFFSKYMPEEDRQQNEYEENCSDEAEYWPEIPQWVDIFHPLHENRVEYDE